MKIQRSAESRKKGVDAKIGGYISRHFRLTGRKLPEAKKRAPAQLFDIAGIRKRNAGGIGDLRSLWTTMTMTNAFQKKFFTMMN